MTASNFGGFSWIEKKSSIIIEITSAESGRASLLQLSPSPHVYHFSLYGCCLLQIQVGVGTSPFILGGACRPLPGRGRQGAYRPPPCRAVGV